MSCPLTRMLHISLLEQTQSIRFPSTTTPQQPLIKYLIDHAGYGTFIIPVAYLNDFHSPLGYHLSSTTDDHSPPTTMPQRLVIRDRVERLSKSYQALWRPLNLRVYVRPPNQWLSSTNPNHEQLEYLVVTFAGPYPINSDSAKLDQANIVRTINHISDVFDFASGNSALASTRLYGPTMSGYQVNLAAAICNRLISDAKKDLDTSTMAAYELQCLISPAEATNMKSFILAYCRNTAYRRLTIADQLSYFTDTTPAHKIHIDINLSLFRKYHFCHAILMDLNSVCMFHTHIGSAARSPNEHPYCLTDWSEQWCSPLRMRCNGGVDIRMMSDFSETDDQILLFHEDVRHGLYGDIIVPSIEGRRVDQSLPFDTPNDSTRNYHTSYNWSQLYIGRRARIFVNDIYATFLENLIAVTEPAFTLIGHNPLCDTTIEHWAMQPILKSANYFITPIGYPVRSTPLRMMQRLLIEVGGLALDRHNVMDATFTVLGETPEAHANRIAFEATPGVITNPQTESDIAFNDITYTTVFDVLAVDLATTFAIEFLRLRSSAARQLNLTLPDEVIALQFPGIDSSSDESSESELESNEPI